MSTIYNASFFGRPPKRFEHYINGHVTIVSLRYRIGNEMNGQRSQPKAWPIGLKYLVQPEYSKVITKDAPAVLNRPASSANAIILEKSGLCPRVRITAITSSQHPANGQFGLFSAQSLAPDSFILYYLGYVHSREDADPDSDYDLSLDRELGIGIDATRMGNEARFINDYRGIADAPNAEFREVWVRSGKSGMEKRMAVFVLTAGKSGKRAKGIPKGSEILVSYGKGFWSERMNEQTD